MAIWSVQFYEEAGDNRPSRYGIVKADTQGAAYELAKLNMKVAQRADVIPQVVRDESTFRDGYTELPSN